MRALRKGLAYCWSVAIAAAPASGLPSFRSLDCTDDDFALIIKQNLTTSRLQRAITAEAES
ncbi:hypothetical protein [Lysinibacter cavernae]|uniref:Uncharacterized protein n=1 Tax=Lysinibacter cavernae TaxID=1640652 RepID=A0A7X5TU47_9MICO|nr:hypothetical protein [Lysinibacter cavernae]NIH55311.1 hypothetical protein [Lysinibacter cavernae]